MEVYHHKWGEVIFFTLSLGGVTTPPIIGEGQMEGNAPPPQLSVIVYVFNVREV